MHAATAHPAWCGPRGRHQPSPHHRGPRGLEDFIAAHDRARRALRRPAHVQGDVLGAARRPRRPRRRAPRRPGGRGGAPVAATCARRCSCSWRTQPQNGYQLIQEIERRTDGVWKPSPGSVYPALQQLEDEGLVRAVEFEGKRAYELTPRGATLRRRQPRGTRRPVRRRHRRRRRGRHGPARPDVPGRRRGHAGRRRRPHRRGQARSSPTPAARSTRSSPRTSPRR